MKLYSKMQLRTLFYIFLCGCAVTILLTFVLMSQVTKFSNSKSHHLAVIIPFRDRLEELLEFLPHMKRFLDAQGVTYTFYVINQADRFRFNRGSLINVGFHLSRGTCDYLVMHDVDLLPLNSRISYAFPEDENSVWHLAAPHLHPKYHYKTYVGGILLMTHRVFEAVNGLSNKYWGWGLEDDEFYARIKASGFEVHRPGDIGTGVNNTFRHIHDHRKRPRDMARLFNQREASRRRDRVTGLVDVAYDVITHRVLSLDDGSHAHLFVVSLKCDLEKTPWCEKKKMKPP